MSGTKAPVTDPHFGDLPLAVRGWLRRLRLPPWSRSMASAGCSAYTS